MQTPQKPRIAGTLAALALVFTVAIAGGIGYEQLERRRDQERYRRIGHPVDIGGRTLNIYCSGEGSPAVVLESDALTPGYSWVFIQKEIAKVTRACWYDRAGYGWSDPGPTPHTSVRSAKDLHELLNGAGLRPPFLLVGDRFGSLNVRVYNGLYPDDVAGMVLVDPVDEREERMGMAGRVPFHLGYPPDLVLRTANRIGLMRLLSRGNRPDEAPKGLTPGERATLSGLWREPKIRAAFLAEQGFSASLEEVRSAGGLGNRPLIVLRPADPFDSPSGPAETARVARMSARGRQIVVKGSGNNILCEAPDAVVGSVREVVDKLRRTR
jgi:pimeloyl-ACP methyl ester carboxylesterase